MQQGSRVRPNFSMVRLTKIRGRKKKKVSATERLISWSKPIRDSEGRTLPLIGRGPDIHVRVCTSDACAAAVRQRER